MIKSIFTLLTLTLLVSCADKKPEHNFNLTGNIKGLKKGTLYIQRIIDTTLVPIDTIQITVMFLA